jgi:phage/plasmid-like protein (TIGR03299 family)
MSHNIAHHTTRDGIAARSIYSLRENPWHKLGTVVERPLSDPRILEAAGLDWTAEKVELRTADMLEPVRGAHAIRRSDNSAILGVVGDAYTALQNRDLLAFFRDVAGTAEMTVETAGALGDGSTVWALARIPGLTLAKGDDISQGYMLIRNSHNGDGCVRIIPTMVRVVCANTLAMAASEEGQRRAQHGRNSLSGGYGVRHTRGMTQALADIATAYARTRADFESTQAAFSALTSKPLNEKAFVAMMAAAFGETTADEGKRAQTMAKDRADAVRTILASATCNVAGTAGTVWAGLNAVTEYIDHDARTRGAADKSDDAQRFASAQFGGEGAKRKAEAWAAALAAV